MKKLIILLFVTLFSIGCSSFDQKKIMAEWFGQNSSDENNDTSVSMVNNSASTLKNNREIEENKITVVEIKKPEEAVTVWDSSLLRVDSDYQQRLGLYVHYKNNTNKKIIGILVKVKIINPFGHTVYSSVYEDETVLEPNERLKNTKFWRFLNNPFIDNEPYDHLWQMADNGTAKIETTVLKVIFEDGAVLKSELSEDESVLVE